MRRILEIAVELGQGISETQTVGRIMSGGALTVDEELIDFRNHRTDDAEKIASVVVSAAGKPAGIFTERDVLKRVAINELIRKKLRCSKS